LLRNGQAVDETATDGKGFYALAVKLAGDYTVEVNKLADQYSSAGNETLSQRGLQRVDVTVDQAMLGGDPPQEMKGGDIYLPVSLVNELARLSSALNNLHVTLSPFADLATGSVVTTVPTPIATAVADAVVAGVVNAAPRFTGVYRGSGPRDGWNAL